MATSFPPAGAEPTRHSDIALGFTLPAAHARGRIVRLGAALDVILANHAYPPVIAQVLGEALVLTALLGSTLKDEGGQLTVQAQAEGGVIDLLVCDYRGGEMRGYLRHDAERLSTVADAPSLGELFGNGYLAITFDQAATGERYQGIVPLEGASLAEAAESYFDQSDQLPSLVRIAVEDRGAEGHVAGGLLLQYLPEGEEGRERLHVRGQHEEWTHVETLGATVTPSELTDEALAPEALIWRLFHDEPEVRVLPPAALRRGCRCSAEHVRDVIGRFPVEERAEMADEDGMIRVDCHFCARVFPIPLAA
ncbi:Hsp33 family molecular chaperone HslO [Sphingomonas quercus]|uniref:Hsp33 family molecular chaperone HslO n=1 Tax=Sphingomonas quercus TaxID=2842451 RepID=UPI00209B0EC5|nr:Hsp33 family molecular chaperone HslO [Sphingomonas quercus]